MARVPRTAAAAIGRAADRVPAVDRVPAAAVNASPVAAVAGPVAVADAQATVADAQVEIPVVVVAGGAPAAAGPVAAGRAVGGRVAAVVRVADAEAAARGRSQLVQPRSHGLNKL